MLKNLTGVALKSNLTAFHKTNTTVSDIVPILAGNRITVILLYGAIFIVLASILSKHVNICVYDI